MRCPSSCAALFHSQPFPLRTCLGRSLGCRNHLLPQRSLCYSRYRGDRTTSRCREERNRKLFSQTRSLPPGMLHYLTGSLRYSCVYSSSPTLRDSNGCGLACLHRHQHLSKLGRQFRVPMYKSLAIQGKSVWVR